MRIDAHHHFWRPARGDYGWLTPAMAALYRDYLPDDLHPLMAAGAIDRSILVQAAPTSAETAFLLELAERTPFVAGVVGWIDFEDPHAARLVDQIAKRSKLVGLRPMVQDIAQDDWLLSPRFAPVFERMIDAGLRFDALIKPRHLPVLARLVDRHPDLAVVIDHAAKPQILEGEIEGWAAAIAQLAQRDSVYCKLSGLVTEAAADWNADSLRPYVQAVISAFGPRRLMWGSDWPVLNGNATYGRWLEATAALLASLSEADQGWVMGRTAAKFYGVTDAFPWA